MKKYLLPSLITATLLLLPSGLSAQDLETGYFLGGNPYAFRLNPAFQNERSIFSLALGQTGAGVWSNLGISSLLYPDANGYLYTFLSDRVDASSFMRKIGRYNRLNLDARVNLLTIGFWSSAHRYFTIDLNVRGLNAASIPYDVFSFWKEGAESRNSFDFSGMGFRAKEFVEAAVGWSKNYDNVFSVGFRVKALVGIGEAEVFAKNMKLTMGSDRWDIQAQSVFHASSPNFSYRLTEDGDLDMESISFQEGNYGPAGYGGALDLGVSWNVLPYLTLSASVLDLGTVRWSRQVNGISPETTYSWVPSESGNAGEDDWEDQIDEAFSDLSEVLRFKDASSQGGAFEALPTQFLLGAEFRMPFYERLSIGALYSGRVGSSFARNSGRVSLNWNPLNFLSLSTGTTLSRLGESVGFAFCLHPAGINLLVGCDYIPFHCVNVSSWLDDLDLPERFDRYAVVPRDQMKYNFYIGLNLAFGRRRLDHAKRFNL